MSDYKKCPFCSEMILADAKKCRFCHSMLDEEGGAGNGEATPPPPEIAPPPPLPLPPTPDARRDLPPERVAAESEKPAYMPPPLSPPPPAPPSSPPSPPGYKPVLKAEKQPAKKSRRKLPIIIGSVVALIIILIIVAINAGRSALRESPIYTEALNLLNTNSEALQYLGEPVEPGSVSGMISAGEGVVEGELEIPVSGPLNKGTVYAEAGGTTDGWNFTLLELEKNDGSRINLLTGSAAGVPEGFLLFAEPGYGFKMNYPQHWTYQFFSDNGVIFFGPEGTAEYDLEVIVELYYTTQAGGIYGSIDEIAADLKSSFSSMAGEITSEDRGRDLFSGMEREYYTFGATFQRDGAQWGNATLVIQRDERLFYVIYYNAPAEIFPGYIDLVFDQIIGSFVFTEDLMY